MQLTDEQFEAMLACFTPEEIPKEMSREELKQRLGNFCDLVELVMQPLPLPPAGATVFKAVSWDHRVISS